MATMILARWWQSAGRGWASRLRAEPRRRCGARPRWRRGADRGCAQWSGDGGGQPWRELARTRWWRGSVGCPALTGSGKKEGGEAARGTGSLAERPWGTGASVRAVARQRRRRCTRTPWQSRAGKKNREGTCGARARQRRGGSSSWTAAPTRVGARTAVWCSAGSRLVRRREELGRSWQARGRNRGKMGKEGWGKGGAAFTPGRQG